MEIIDRQVEAAERIERRTARQVDRLFGLERLRAERARHRAVHRDGRHVHGHTRQEVGRGGGEILLVQRRRTEAVRHRPAQCEPVGQFVAQRQLAVHRIAEVAVMFVATRRGCGEAGEQVGVELQIAGIAVAVDVGAGRGRQAAEALRTRRRGTAGEGAAAGRRGAPAIHAAQRAAIVPRGRSRRLEERAGLVRLRIAGADLEDFVTIFAAEGEGQRTRQADIELARQIGVRQNLREGETAGIERTLALRTEGDVDAVFGPVAQLVAAEAEREVALEARNIGPDAAGRRQIVDARLDLGQVTVRRQTDEIGVGRRRAGRDRREVAIGRRGLLAEVRRRQAVAMAIGEEGVEVGRTQRLAHVDEEIEVLRLRIAVAEVEAVEARFARVEGGRRRTDVIGPQVVALAVGEVAVAIFAGEVEEAAVADRQADVDAIGQHRTVARLALTVAVRLQVARVSRVERRRIAEQAVEIGHPVQRRHIFAVAHLRAAAFARGLELDVDHARDRIRAILRGGAVAQHLDPLDRERGDHVHVDRRRTTPDGAVDVEQRRHVAPLAIEQHQRLVGVQAAQRRGPRHVGAVGDRGLREVERGDQLVQRLVELAGA